MTLELGTRFYQDCEYSEESILPSSTLKVLTYAAKTSAAPFSMSKGSDVTSISTTIDGDMMTVLASASDSAWFQSAITPPPSRA